MSFGVRKCAVLDVVSGSVVVNGGIEYQDGAIHCLEEGDVYRYLGVEQFLLPYVPSVKQRLVVEFKKRLKVVCHSVLSSRLKVQATNMWASSLFP